MTAEEIAKKIIEATGAQPGDTIQIITPTFDRRASDPGPVEGASVDFAALAGMTAPQLRELGLFGSPGFDEPVGKPEKELWLFPHEWYGSIPAGFEIASINGDVEKFEPGVTDNDKRFGFLAYGIMGPAAP